MSKPLVSIIIVNWNGKKWLKKCLDSLLAQTYDNFEILVVDNASSDESLVFLEQNYPTIKTIQSKTNLGFAGGNNLGIKNASGAFLLLLNNDTWVERNFLGRLMSELDEYKYDVLSPREKKYNNEKIMQGEYSSTTDVLGHPVYVINNMPSLYLTGVCLLFRAELYIETGGLDDDYFMYCEEIDWFWRLNLLNKKFAYSKDIYIHHAGAGGMGKGMKYQTFLWRNQNTLQMLLKNYAWYSLVWILPIYFFQNIIETVAFLAFLKPKIASSYIEGWWFNIKNIKKIMIKRRWVQRSRLAGDRDIIRVMYFGSGKLRHLLLRFTGDK